MSVYIISYDLRKPNFDYKPLYAALAEMDAERVQDSVWGVDTDSSGPEIWDYLWQFLHSERDRLFVIPFNKKDYKSKNAISKLGDL